MSAKLSCTGNAGISEDMGATSADGGRPAGPVRTRWLVAIVVVWAALFGAAYALGTGISTNRTTTVTRSIPVTPTVAPGSPATSQTVTPPPPVKVKPIVPMPPAPILRPYRLAVFNREPTVTFAASHAAFTPASRAVSSGLSIGTGPGGMGEAATVPPITTRTHATS